VQSGVGTAVYTINSTAGACDGMSVGNSVAGTANMNGFLPFQNSTTGVQNMWNTNIANAAVDPNNASIQTTSGFAGIGTRVLFGPSSGAGIPYAIVDSSQTPAVPVYVTSYTTESDVLVAPIPSNVPIEGNPTDCVNWPNNYFGDGHALVADRNTCWLYELNVTKRCNGLLAASSETIWDMQDGNYRPWGWTSADVAGLSIFAGLIKYDEAASGQINHAIRFTMAQSKDNANDGYFVEPASHASGVNYGAPTVQGMRLRLKASYNISGLGLSTINTAILTAMQQYGLIMADNGGSGYYIGSWDSRWSSSDLTHLPGIPFSDFDVIDGPPGSTEMNPGNGSASAYPGMDTVSAPTGPPPVINSFTASDSTVSAGSPVTFNISVSGDSYDYIDMAGPVRLTQNGGGPGVNTGSVTVYPTATQTYMLYSLNQYGDNYAGTFDTSGIGPGYGVTVSTPITIEVPGSIVAPPTFTPSPGAYATTMSTNTVETISSTYPLKVTLNTTTYPFAAFYYTTDGSTPTYPPTGTTLTYPTIYQPMSKLGNHTSYIPLSASTTINALAVAPYGYASPSAISTGVFQIGPVTATPTFSPVAGSYGVAQTVAINDSTSGNTIYYTTNGTTPTTTSTQYSSAITVSANETLEAIATSVGNYNSAVATATYSIGGTAATPTFSPVAGNYVGAQTVTIGDTSSGAAIYYTTNGITPTTSSTPYSTPVTVSAAETLQAIAAGNGYTGSAVGSAAYTIVAEPPTFSPVSGSYVGPQTVTISDTSSGVTIYYTTNGTAPSTSSPVYGSAITVSANETVQAIAASSGLSASAIGSAAYTIQASTPTFSPVAGNYGVTLTVTISDATPSSAIYYTTDGSTPTYPVTSTTQLYSAPISVPATVTLNAIATAAGNSNSSVGSAVYTITIGGQAATPTFSPNTGGVYIGPQTVSISDTSIGTSTYYTLTPGTTGTTPTTNSTLYTGPVSVPSTSVLEAIAVGGGFTPSAAGSAPYNITIVASYVQQCLNSASSSTVSCTLSGVTAGDALMIGVWENKGSGSVVLNSVTSSSGTPSNVIANYSGSSTYGLLSAYLLPNAAAGSITITANFSGTASSWISVVEYTNVAASPLDVSGDGSTGSSGALNSANFTTTATNDMLWSMCYGEFSTWTPGTTPVAWTQVKLTTDNHFFIEDGLAGAAGSYYGQCNNSSSGPDSIITVALK
jgi:hypothetical protein